MALDPRDERHARQIEAGTSGRNRGHAFEKRLTAELVGLQIPAVEPWKRENRHLVWDSPAIALVRYIAAYEGWTSASVDRAYWLGGLATSGEGDTLLSAGGAKVTGSKSDIVLDVIGGHSVHRRGISVKTCFNAKATNAQLYCTTASAFCELLRQHAIPVSSEAERALRMFCGDPGHRPMDDGLGRQTGREASDERWFWEELPTDARLEWQRLFQESHAAIFTILLKNAYANDPAPPTYVLHVRQNPA